MKKQKKTCKQKGGIFTAKLFYLSALLLIFNLSAQAQVTIGSDEEPDSNSLLDLKQTGTTSKKGFLLPRVPLSSVGSPEPMTQHVKGMTVYNTENVSNVTEGFYYNNGERWIKIEVPQSWLISGTENVSMSSKDDIYHLGHVTIGKNQAVDPTAILDINASDKGVLLPRVTLTGSKDVITIPYPTTGLLVYNTGDNPTFSTKGYLYWDGEAWKLFTSSSSDAATATLNCSGASLSPAQQITGGTAIIDGTVLQIPYTASNGGSFKGATLVSNGNSNVTAVVSDGMLAVGNGVISFALSGTPTVNQQAPNGIVFDLQPFLDANPGITGCNDVVVGNVLSASIEQVAVMGRLMLMTDDQGNDTGTQYYAVRCDSPDGKFSVRAGVPVTQTSIAYGNQYLNVQIRNNQNTSVPVIWNFKTDYGTSSLGNSGLLTIPAQRWGGDQNSGITWTNATGNNTLYGVYWGQVGIYDASNNGPEYRRYTWIPQGAENTVSYEINVMVALDTTTPTVAVAPTMVKCYIKFTQVTAAQ